MIKNKLKILILAIILSVEILIPDDLAGKLYFRYALPDSICSDSIYFEPDKETLKDSESGFYRKGVIYRGISFSGGSDPGIVSGLNLELKGSVAENVEVSAFISDDNMAVSQEGSTESLSDIENIYIQFRHPHFFSRMGNFTINYGRGDFGRLENDLAGAMLNISRNGSSAEGYISAGGDTFSSTEIAGIEGVAGPYKIFAEGSHESGRITPGSETVWLNGTKLSRGREYYFDELSSELYFLSGTPVHSGDRIIIDYRFASDTYKNITYGFDGSTSLYDDKLQLNVNYFKTEDDSESPLQYDMTREIEDALGSSEDGYVFVSGAEYAENEGSYDLMLPDSVFVWVGKGNGDYNVRFSYFETAGEYNISYDSTGTAYFVHDPVNGGKYLPLIRIDAPTSYSRVFGEISYNSDRVKFRSEAVVSGRNVNTFYNREADFNGYGDREELTISTDESKYGTLKFSAGRKYYNDELILPSRLSDVISEKEIDTGQLNGTGSFMRYNGRVSHDYKGKIVNGYSIIFTEKGENVSETGHIADSYASVGNYYYKADLSIYQTDIDTVRIDKRNIYFNPGYSNERWDVGPYYGSTELSGISPEENTSKYGNRTGFRTGTYSAKHTIELARFDRGSAYYLERLTNTVELNNRIGSVFNSDAVWTNIINDYTDSSDTKNDMAKIRINFNKENRYRLYAEYETERTQFYPAVRAYYKVEEGTGEYIYSDGEYYPDDFGNYSYYIVRSDKPSNVTGVSLNMNSYLDMDDAGSNTNILYWLTRIDIEQDFSVEEKSKLDEVSDIILLNLSTFQGDSTVTGSVESKTTFYFMKNHKQSADYSFLYNKNLYREYLNYSENSLLKEHRLVLKSTNGSFLHRAGSVFTSNKRYGASEVLADDIVREYSFYNIRHNIKPDLSWYAEIEYGIEKEKLRNIRTDSYRISPGISAGFLRYGIVRAGIDIITVVSDSEIPFVMNNGYGKGSSYKWNLNADYRFSSNIFGNLIYTGRFLSWDVRPYHELRLEIRMEL